jgi:hypothetical protein
MKTYASLNPFTCNILICLTIVLLPDSPAPAENIKTKYLKERKRKRKPFIPSAYYKNVLFHENKNIANQFMIFNILLLLSQLHVFYLRYNKFFKAQPPH